MSDKEAKEFVDKCRAVLSDEPGSPRSVDNADLLRFILRLHDELKRVESSITMLWRQR